MADETIRIEGLEDIVAGLEDVLVNDEMRNLYKKACDLCDRYNIVILSDEKGSREEEMKLDEDIRSVVGNYVGESRKVCFEWLKSQADPMLEAVKLMEYPTIRIHDTKVGEEIKIPHREIISVTKQIDLLDLHKYVGGAGIGKDPDWMHYAQKMNQLMTAYAATQLNVDPREIYNSYDMSQVAKKIELGATPTSNRQLLTVLGEVIATMIGPDYKPKSYDVAYLKFVYGGKGRKALTLRCSNHKAFRKILMDICHRIVFDMSYDLDYKKMKKK